MSLRCIEEAKEQEIILLKLPSNTTHILQSLDVTVFGPVKTAWYNIVKDWYRQSANKPITKNVFPVLLKRLFLKMNETTENPKKRFQ